MLDSWNYSSIATQKLETFVLSNIITGFRSYGKSHQERIGYVAENGALFDLSLIDLFFVVLVICCILYFSTHSLHVVYFFKINKLSFILVIKNWTILNLFFIKHKPHANDWEFLQKYCMLYKTNSILMLYKTEGCREGCRKLGCCSLSQSNGWFNS